MNRHFLSSLGKIIRFLQNNYLKYTLVETNGTTSYHSLSPIKNADGGEYYDALLWALRNRKSEDIKNVALTGPYGSGKSSILKTFQENHKSEFSFLNISLATFKEELVNDEEPEVEGNGNPQDKDLLRLIELSILQQIFYHEEDKKIPDSRFKKIRSFKKSSLIFIASSVLVLMICCFDLFAPDKFKSIFHLTLSANADLIVHLASLALFITGTYIILLRSVRLVNSIKISKFKFKDAEIEIDKGISKSILNNHLDEILYFFEVTPYSVVIIEDLDRFQQTEIFTKLRELNLLINNSKKVKREIVFIYAVRDDMFQDKDRTKFFDFIVPVIPVINSSNSNEKLLGVIKHKKYVISDDLIDDISLFIDDMRLLYNITNEYHIYHSKLDKKLNQDKLLGIIVYKNIHPNDFVSLSNSAGVLFDVLNNKEVYIKNALAKLDKEIETTKAEILEIESIQIKDIRELRRLYILEYVSKLNGIIAFEINGTNYAFNNVLDDGVFDYFRKNKAKYNYMALHYANYYNHVSDVIPQKFADVEKAVDLNFSYSQREAQINDWTANKTEGLKEKIATLEKEKIVARHFKLKDIIARGSSKIELKNEKQNLLVNILLRNGYIDEDYLDYISIFYEGSIAKEDRQFLLNIKSQIELEFDFKLKKIDKLIGKISPLEFEKSYILNFNLLDYLLKAQAQQSKLNSVLEILINQSHRSLSFIDGFIDNGLNVADFILQISKKWSAFWKYIDSQSNFTKERKLQYFKLIMTHTEINDIVLLAAKSNLHFFLCDRPDFLTIIADTEKAKQIISNLKLKFRRLEFTGAPKELVDFTYEGNYYELSIDMIRKVLEAKGSYSESDFSTQNYYAIQNSDLNNLIKYIDENINKYILDVYLNLETNIHDPENILISLLNNTAISIQSRVKIIERSTVKITDLASIDDLEIHESLLINSKLEPVWENLIEYYHNVEDVLGDAIINFMNIESNADTLSVTKVDEELSSDELDIVERFLKSLVAENDLTDTTYGKLLKSVPYSYESIEFEKVSVTKVHHLINTFTLDVTPVNFNYLKLHFPDMQIALLEKRHIDYIKKLNEFEPDENDLVKLLNSTAFNISEKNLLYQSISSDQIYANVKLSQTIGGLLLENPTWLVGKLVLKYILTHSLSTAERIQLFNTHFRIFDKTDVTEILRCLPCPYSDIATFGKRPLIDLGQENSFFANNLKSLNYISKMEHERKGVRISTFKK